MFGGFFQPASPSIRSQEADIAHNRAMLAKAEADKKNAQQRLDSVNSTVQNESVQISDSGLKSVQ